MNTLKQFKIASIAIITLGIIHVLATPIVIQGLKFLNLKTILCIGYMFVATGIAVIALGWLQYYILKRLQNHSYFLAILKGTVVFILVSGIGAVATMWDNPFAYLILLVALYESFLLRTIQPKGIPN